MQNDSNLFLKNQESVTNVLRFFENLSKAIGTTTNLEKKQFFQLTQMTHHKYKEILQ